MSDSEYVQRSHEDQRARIAWFADRANALIADYNKRHPKTPIASPLAEPEEEEGSEDLDGMLQSERDEMANVLIKRLGRRDRGLED